MKAGLGRADHVKLVPNVEQGQHAKCKMVIFKINLLQQPGRALQMSSEHPTQCLNIIIHPLEQISTDSLWETVSVFQIKLKFKTVCEKISLFQLIQSHAHLWPKITPN